MKSLVESIIHEIKKDGMNNIMKITFLGIRITTLCNLNCKICIQEQKKGIVPIKKYKEIIDEVTEKGKRKNIILSICGGEPTILGNDLIYLIEYAKNRNMQIVLYTNGFTISSIYAKKIVNSRLDTIIISLYSSNLKEHDKSRRVKGSWNRAIDAINFLGKWREKIESELKIKVCPVITNQNYDKISSLLEMVGGKIKFVDEFDIFPIKEQKEFFLSKKQINLFNQEHLPKIIKLCKKYNFKELEKKIGNLFGKTNKRISNSIKGRYYDQLSPVCYNAFTSIYIDGPTGNIYPCGYLSQLKDLKMRNKSIIGNIIKNNSSLESIRVEKFKDISSFPIEICKDFCGAPVCNLNNEIEKLIKKVF